MDYNHLKKLNGLQTQVNIILINWDPLDIQKASKFAHNVYLEYTRYVDDIIVRLGDIELLTDYLWNLAIDMTGQDRNNLFLTREIDQVVKNLETLKKDI
ncbi:hypothetical protein [Marivirga arenosa]|uniref:Uncharacterized protein n=1 Tax=Marivirga arenosa TaxID=3059076 RepID=A0AA49GED5_9BACT|nr:hypothetical protein [Marivirga sp. BKB1-2]WKK80184.2 hypothetical protein QYS47_23850 [Marivirga sp. BKB1-2]